MSDHATAAPALGELAAFLRARRERTSPRDVGLPDVRRRRTPGLRREEVATLAGVSVDYLVRLEQGRDVHPSAEVLAALADAMRMTEDERRHFFHLGVISGNQALCPTRVALDGHVAPTVRALLDALDATPAFVLGPVADVLAWNSSWAAVVGAVGLLDVDPGEAPNLARYVFGHPAARSAFPEWRTDADEQVGRLRRASTRWSHDERVGALVAELRHEPEFEVRWNAHPIVEKRRGTQRLNHPEVADLALSYEVLELAEETEQQLVTWLPADDVSAARLAILTDGPRLRLVERS